LPGETKALKSFLDSLPLFNCTFALQNTIFCPEASTIPTTAHIDPWIWVVSCILYSAVSDKDRIVYGPVVECELNLTGSKFAYAVLGVVALAVTVHGVTAWAVAEREARKEIGDFCNAPGRRLIFGELAVGIFRHYIAPRRVESEGMGGRDSMVMRRMFLHFGADKDEIRGERRVWENHGERELRHGLG
jgi:hypothetical protein